MFYFTRWNRLFVVVKLKYQKLDSGGEKPLERLTYSLVWYPREGNDDIQDVMNTTDKKNRGICSWFFIAGF